MKVKITDSRDIRRVFTKVKDDSEGKAVKKLLRMLLGQQVKDSSPKVKFTLWNQNKIPESIDNILKGSYKESDLRKDVEELPWGKQMVNFFTFSKNIFYDWKLEKFNDKFIQMSSKDRDGNVRTLQVSKVGKVKDDSQRPERKLLRMILGNKLKDSAKSKTLDNKFKKKDVEKLTDKEKKSSF